MDLKLELVVTEEVAAAIADGQPAFAALAERHRRELHVHCYRMLASFHDAEDAVQETFLRAWRGRDSFESGSMFRAWLYRIATNVCLDMLRRSSHRARVMRSFAAWPRRTARAGQNGPDSSPRASVSRRFSA